MKYNSNLFPAVQTKRVHVSSDTNKVDITILLYNQGDQISFNSFSQSSFVDKSFLYMVLVDSEAEKYLPQFLNAHTRLGLLNKWDSINRKDKGNIIYTKIPMTEVLQNHNSIEFNQSDIQGRNNFEIMYETSISHNRISKIQENRNLEKLHLLCFINNEIDDSLKSTKISFGTSASYDLLLSKTQTGILRVPEFRDVFYITNPGKSNHLQPYYGAAHYHGETNPGPNGYIGWMAGHEKGLMGEKLEVREVLNYKITSDLPLAATSTKQRQNPNMAFSLDGFDPSYDQEITQQIHSFFDMSNTLRDAEKSFEKYKNIESVNNINILDYGTNLTSHINMVYDPSSESGALSDSHYGFIASVNFKRLAKYFSRFGFLISLYEKYDNQQMIRKMLYYSNILNLRVFRKRLENKASQPNKQSSLKYVEYDKNEPSFEIISSSDKKNTKKPAFLITDDMLKDNLYKTRNNRGSIFESRIHTLNRTKKNTYIFVPGSPHSRQFIIRDYDIFNNIDTGKYTYKIELEVCDGISMVLEQETKQLKEFLKQFESFINKASVPHNVLSLDGHSGSYNYNKQQFTSSFLEDASNQSIVTQAINYLYNTQSLLSGKTRQDLVAESTVNLQSAFNLSFIKINRLRELLIILDNSYKSLKNVILSGEEKIIDYGIANTEYTIPSMSSRYPAKIISVSTKTGIVIESFKPTSLLADFSKEETNYQPSKKFENYKKELTKRDTTKFLKKTKSGSTMVSPYRFCLVKKTRNDTKEKKLSKESTNNQKSASSRGKSTKHIHPDNKTHGSVKTVISSEEYRSAKKEKKSQIDKKIILLQDPSLRDLGFSEKPEFSFYSSALKKFYKGISFGLSKGGTELFSNLPNFRDNELFNFILPDTSAGFREAICRAAYRGDKKNFFLDEVEKSYKDLSLTKEKVSSIYDMLLKMFSNYRVLSDDIINNKSYKTNFLNEGKTKKIFDQPRPGVSLENNPFEDHGRQLKIYTPGLDPQPIDISDIEIENQPMLSPGIIFVKLDPMVDEGQAIAVNNSIFLEI